MRRLGFLLLPISLACGQTEAPATPPGVSSVHSAPPLREPPAPSPWPPEAASLRESLERFEDIRRCEASLRAELPTEVAEVLADLAYDSVVGDVCAGLSAVKSEDPTRCDALSVRAVREGCLRRVAIWSGEPELCPPARGVEGRDPLCLAWAARDPGLCDGVSPTERTACLAVLANAAERCRDDRCRGWVQRYGPVVATDTKPRRRVTGASIVVERGGESERYDRGSLQRGLVLRAHECGYELTLQIGGAYEEGPSATVHMTLRPDLATEAVDGRLRWTSTAPPEPLRAVALELHGRPTRGARLRGTLRGEHRLGSELRKVTVTFDTWLRDVEPLDAHCTQARGVNQEPPPSARRTKRTVHRSPRQHPSRPNSPAAAPR